MCSIEDFYNRCKKHIIKEGFEHEIESVSKQSFEEIWPVDFLHHYIYVVLNTGMKNQAAKKMYKDFLDKGVNSINHEGKRKAIKEAINKYEDWYNTLLEKDTLSQKLEFLEELPWIGESTKYHLARNIGFNVAKPDRHLKRIAEHWGENDVQTFCEKISNLTGDSIAEVDLIIWRYCNLNPNNKFIYEGDSGGASDGDKRI